MSIYDYKFENSKNEEISMKDYKDKVILIVNTASECGFTGQYEGLEDLYEKYNAQGLEVLGFPCNQFGGQETGNDEQIQKFCQMKFGIKFPVFKKIEVTGENTHPLYTYLTNEAPGLLGSKKIKWNFTKFLVDKNGKVLKRFATTTKPESIVKDIVKLL